MNRSRRGVAGLTAAVVIGSALTLGTVHLILGLAVDKQEMSLGGLDPAAMSAGAWAAGGLLAAFLLLCGVLLARVAVTDRSPGRGGRALLVGAGILHAVLATLAVGLAGWLAFAVLILVFCLVMLTLTLYPQPGTGGGRRPAGGGSGAPQLGDGDAHLGQQPAQ